MGWSWLKFNYLGLKLGMALYFSISTAKSLNLKVRKLIPTFVKVTGKTPAHSTPPTLFSTLPSWGYVRCSHLLQVIITVPLSQTPKFRNFVLSVNPPSLLETHPAIRDRRVLLKSISSIN